MGRTVGSGLRFWDFCIWNIFLGTLGQGTAELEGGFHSNVLGLVGRMIFLYCWRLICKA